MEHSDYFDIKLEGQSLLKLRLSNFWDDAFASKMGQRFMEEFTNAVDSFKGRKFVIVTDLSNFRTPSLASKELMDDSMVYALEHGLYKAVEVTPKALTRMVVESLARDHSESMENEFERKRALGVRIVVESEEEANRHITRLINEIIE